MPEKKFIILVDGSSYLYRAFHALPALVNSKGFPTGAVYGFISMLKRLIADYNPSHMVVVFDSKGKTFRNELYQDYKANRKEMPKELIQQIKPILDATKAMGLPILMIEGIEADDIIGTLAKEASKKNIKTIISTGDKDLTQLVTENVTLINTMTNTLLDSKGVENKFGVRPERMIDYLTLVGDISDNIPGVQGVGPKTAVKWLQEFDSLDGIISNIHQLKGKIKEKLQASIPHMSLTKQLVTIKLDVDVPFEWDHFQIKEADKKFLISLFKEMEFKNWLSKLLSESQDIHKKHYETYDIITNETLFEDWVTRLGQAKIITFDTETTHLNYMLAKLVGLSFAIENRKACYIPFGHTYPNAPKQLKKDFVLQKLNPIFENKNIKKIAQHAKYGIEILLNEGIKVEGLAYDTMLESYILDSISSNHSMDANALKYLGWRTITFEEIAGKGVKQLSFDQIPIEKAGVYAAEDADITLQLHQALWPRIEKNKKLKGVFLDIEMPLIQVLTQMERYGVLIDPKKLNKQSKEMQKRLDELQEEAFIIAGEEFNLNSPKQLQEILFCKLKLPILQKTPSGQASTSEQVLQDLAHEFSLPKIIIEHRSLSKLISTYTSRLPLLIHPETGRIHTSYNQVGTATGRLSSSNPNLQNIPIRSKEGRRIREAFIAPKNYKFVSADYSQIELRLLAHIARDPILTQAFKDNLDIHQATAAEIFDVPLDQVSKAMRRGVKAINFGLIYGMSAFGLTKQLGVDRSAAQNYIDRYFAKYPSVQAYMDQTKSLAKRQGFVETLWGRRLYLPDIHASQIPRQRAAERTAINAPLQGSAADIIKLAMIRIHHWLESNKIDAKMIMQVHDELVFEVHENHLDTVIKEIQKFMTNVISLDVPLLVSVGIGDNWDQASDH